MAVSGSAPDVVVELRGFVDRYQVEPFKASHNADALVLVMAVLSLALVCIPLIPGLRDIPRWIPLYRLIWREHYRSLGTPTRTS